jgi:hypothetical protein
MEVWVRVIIRIVTAIMSIADSTNLRNRVYELKEEHEVMWTALDDISRMHKDHPAGDYAKDTLEKIKHKYGR